MDLGISLPTYGPLAPPETIVRIAQTAEELDYAAVWTFERLLAPIDDIDILGQRAPVPEPYAVAYDPLETLAYVAARTSKIKLGVSVLNAPLHVPVMLAKRLATLDKFSDGRVIAGLGQGWMQEEYATANVSRKLRGRGVEELIAAMRAAWAPDPVSFDGQFYRIPPSRINPKPVQPGGIPIVLGAVSPAAIARAARIADGFNPIAMSFDSLQASIALFRASAQSAGRDPSTLEVIVRVNSDVTAEPMGAGRPYLGGSPEEIAEDMRPLRDLGVDHLFFTSRTLGLPPIEERVRLMYRLRNAAAGARLVTA
jgi:probable F420-dependent oxidoreductase